MRKCQSICIPELLCLFVFCLFLYLFCLVIILFNNYLKNDCIGSLDTIRQCLSPLKLHTPSRSELPGVTSQSRRVDALSGQRAQFGGGHVSTPGRDMVLRQCPVTARQLQCNPIYQRCPRERPSRSEARTGSGVWGSPARTQERERQREAEEMRREERKGKERICKERGAERGRGLRRRRRAEMEEGVTQR